MNGNEIKVLIADDSYLMRNLLTSILNEDSDFKIVGYACDGKEALEKVIQLNPDIITMDIEMPIMNGFEATKNIMAEKPTPIVVISSHANDHEMNTVFNSLKAGALTVLEKPVNVFSDNFAKQKEKIKNTVRAMSEISVVTRRIKKNKETSIGSVSQKNTFTGYKVVALGASTGGPKVLNYICNHLPMNFPVPIVIVQHITPGFILGLVNWMQSDAKVKVNLITENYMELLPGNVYFADDRKHLVIVHGNNPIATFDDSPPLNQFKPSVSKLFASLAKSYPGRSVGGLLTGMGCDGADGLLEMKQRNCLTFVQDKESCVVDGMPKAAKLLDAADYELSLDSIPTFLLNLFKQEVFHG